MCSVCDDNDWAERYCKKPDNYLNDLLCAVHDAAKTTMPLSDGTLIEIYNALREELINRKILSA